MISLFLNSINYKIRYVIQFLKIERKIVTFLKCTIIFIIKNIVSYNLTFFHVPIEFSEHDWVKQYKNTSIGKNSFQHSIMYAPRTNEDRVQSDEWFTRDKYLFSFQTCTRLNTRQ